MRFGAGPVERDLVVGVGGVEPFAPARTQPVVGGLPAVRRPIGGGAFRVKQKVEPPPVIVEAPPEEEEEEAEEPVVDMGPPPNPDDCTGLPPGIEPLVLYAPTPEEEEGGCTLRGAGVHGRGWPVRMRTHARGAAALDFLLAPHLPWVSPPHTHTRSHTHASPSHLQLLRLRQLPPPLPQRGKPRRVRTGVRRGSRWRARGGPRPLPAS